MYPINFKFVKSKTELVMKRSLFNDLPLYISKTLAQYPWLTTDEFRKSTKQWETQSMKQ